MDMNDTAESPLSSAGLRYLVGDRVEVAPGPIATRPFGLRAAVAVPRSIAAAVRYCPVRQVAVDELQRPLIEMGVEAWENSWGWEES